MKLYDRVAQVFRHLQPADRDMDAAATPVTAARWRQDGPARPGAKA